MDFTEEQQAIIDKQIKDAVAKAVKETTEELTRKNNDDFSKYRQKRDEDEKKAVEKAKSEAGMTAEELAKKQVEEQMKAKDTELAELRAYKKRGELTKKLQDAGVPTLFVNDSRLQSAEDGAIDEVIKTIKDEFSKCLPNGATIDTNVSTNTSKGSSEDAIKKAKFAEFAKMR